jgi:deglycase
LAALRFVYFNSVERAALRSGRRVCTVSAPELRLRAVVESKAPANRLTDIDAVEIIMANELKGRTIAVLATDGVEQVELTEPAKALKDAGANVEVVSDKQDKIQGFNHHDKASTIPVDRPLEKARPENYDGLLLPGGVINPDALRLVPAAIDFVRHFVQAKKPVAAICHGPWTLIDAGGVRGKRMTSWPSLKTDLTNAGAKWVDEQVTTDVDLVTSRKPADLPAFNKMIIELFREARRDRASHHAAA